MSGFFEANQKISFQAGIDVVRILKEVSRVAFVSSNDRYCLWTIGLQWTLAFGLFESSTSADSQ